MGAQKRDRKKERERKEGKQTKNLAFLIEVVFSGTVFLEYLCLVYLAKWQGMSWPTGDRLHSKMK
jgi:hypothetical protein